MFVTLLVISYILGSIPTGKLIAGYKGIDIETYGSGNTGATNIHRALGVKWAFIVALLDVMKAFLPTILALNILTNETQVVMVAFCSAVGHTTSIFLRFRGGKAVSTYIGMLLAIIPQFTFIWIILWFLALKVSHLMSLVNILLTFLFIPALFLTKGITFALFGLFMWLFILYKHRANIRRLFAGKELPLSI